MGRLPWLLRQLRWHYPGTGSESVLDSLCMSRRATLTAGPGHKFRHLFFELARAVEQLGQVLDGD